MNGTSTTASTLNVSGITTLNNTTIIKGILYVNNGAPYAVNNYTLNNGSLVIGDTLVNYGGEWWGELLMFLDILLYITILHYYRH